MKIEQLIVQQLYNSKKVTLQDIGTFYLAKEITLPPESDKDQAMPENAVSFEFNKRAVQDEDLVSFIVSQTRKIRPLAASDLESYSILAKQFLNIGKPFPLEGLGVLQKTQEGEYKFIQGEFMNAKLEAPPALLKEKTEEEISFAAPAKATSGKKWLWLLLIVAGAAVAATVYYFISPDNKDIVVQQAPVNNDTLPSPKDTTANTQPTITDTVKPTVDSAFIKAGYNFRVIIREFNTRDAAEKFRSKFATWGYRFSVYSADSATYKIGIPFTKPLSDTLRIRDSLRILFNTRTYVETN